ncbi:MAG: dihydrodipicolinate synthase family protein [Myxococcota bacterium]|nr:dihydrodipicolinate synthase family protein [Myxococcota bacterium]
MRSVEQTRPKPGLSVPVVSVLDEGGALLEEDQRAVVRFVIQEGFGADVVFAAGTTGEWDRIGPAAQRAVVQIASEEVAKANAALGAGDAARVECWAGVTAHSPEDTLENLDFAIAQDVDAAVLAPLSVRGLADPVRFVMRDVADLLDARAHRIPVYLYDNADIAADPRIPHIRTRQVKALSRLDFVRGIKVSAPLPVLGNYTRAARGFRERGEFGIYVGNAMLIFDIFRPRHGLWGAIAEHWQRRRMRGGLPIGVVAGPANALPREWARAWQVCRAGDEERMEGVRRVLEAFRDATRVAAGKRTVACLKRALLRQGVIACDAVAEGTPALLRHDAERFDALFDGVRELAAHELVPTWVTRAPTPASPDPGRVAAGERP